MKGSHFGTVKRLSTYVANGIWKLGIGDQEAGDTACVQLVDQGIDLWIHDGLTNLKFVSNHTQAQNQFVCNHTQALNQFVC